MYHWFKKTNRQGFEEFRVPMWIGHIRQWLVATVTAQCQGSFKKCKKPVNPNTCKKWKRFSLEIFGLNLIFQKEQSIQQLINLLFILR